MSNYAVYLHQKTAKEKNKREFWKELKENRLEITTFLGFMFSLGFIFSFIKFGLTKIV